jgi:hypothetical protein
MKRIVDTSRTQQKKEGKEKRMCSRLGEFVAASIVDAHEL